MASAGRSRDGTTELKVLTLNCWGLKLPKPFCELRKERMAAIGEKLAEGEYQVVLLQEVWVQADYEGICAKVFKVLPHSHYFHSGVFGSGVCIFSKFPILETLHHRFPVNGSPYQVLQGDWYGQKSVGLAQIWVNELRVHVYITHTHADYPGGGAGCQDHRVLQAFELSQFVRNTSAGCDAVIVGGDLNNEPSVMGYNMVLANGNLQDCWLQQLTPHDDSQGMTCNKCENSFTKPGRRPSRIDYLLYRSNAGCDVICDDCRTVLETVPDRSYSYSDHSGVSATFRLRKNPTAMSPERLTSAVMELYAAATVRLQAGVDRCHNDRIFYILTSCITLLALVFLVNLDTRGYLTSLITCIKLLLTVTLGLALWSATVLTYREENVLRSAKKDMEIQIQANTS